MSRGKLDRETAASIENQVPAVNELRKIALGLHPAMISMQCPVGSRLPVAAVCFHDATSTLQEVRYALFEALAHLWWYREHQNPPNDPLAIFFGRFYIDDVALRLYATGEHLANAIISMLEISSNDLKSHRTATAGQGSEQAVVGRYLIAEKPNHPITIAIVNLITGTKWLDAINYRNEWVHSKPPILSGSGIEFERRNRLQVWGDAVGVTLGGGDEPRYSIDDLVGIMKPAALSLTEAVRQCLEFYVQLVHDSSHSAS